MAYFSNATEGANYEERWCSRCMQLNDQPMCAVWEAHLSTNYNECNKAESPLHVLIPRSADGLSNEQCRMFRAKLRLIRVRCPWHDEKTPSCHVDLSDEGSDAGSRRRVLCFGCGREATLPELEAAMDAVGRRGELADALEAALRHVGR